MVSSQNNVNEFLHQKKLAVVGVSRNHGKFGNMIYCELKARGYQVMAVNPNADMIEGDRCYAGLGALPEKPDGVILAVPSKQGVEIVEETARLGIRHVWIQQGAESPEIEKRCRELDLVAISGECIFIFLEPVKSIHGFHRFFKQLFGKMPK